MSNAPPEMRVVPEERHAGAGDHQLPTPMDVCCLHAGTCLTFFATGGSQLGTLIEVVVTAATSLLSQLLSLATLLNVLELFPESSIPQGAAGARVAES